MIIELKDFSITSQKIIEFSRSKTPWIKRSEFHEAGWEQFLKSIDRENPLNYDFALIDFLQTSFIQKLTKNNLYYKIEDFLNVTYNIDKTQIEESMLSCLYMPLFKNIKKYEISKNVYEYTEKDIHIQLFLMKRGGLYKNAPAFDNLLEYLNQKNGIPNITQADKDYFIETLKAG